MEYLFWVPQLVPFGYGIGSGGHVDAAHDKILLTRFLSSRWDLGFLFVQPASELAGYLRVSLWERGGDLDGVEILLEMMSLFIFSPSRRKGHPGRVRYHEHAAARCYFLATVRLSMRRVLPKKMAAAMRMR